MSLQLHKSPFSFLFIAGALGLLMRSMSWIDLPLPYTHLLHAHSHVGFQGWLYLSLFLLSIHVFLSPDQRQRGKYNFQLKCTVGVLVALLVAFLWQGYAAVSIALSTVFQLLNYWFIYRFWRHLNESPSDLPKRFMKAGMVFGLLSTLAPYHVGYLSASGMKGTDLYQAALYFFFHFQYNGWFAFSLFGILLQWLQSNGYTFQANDRRFFTFLWTSTVFGYSLSLLGLSLGQLWHPVAWGSVLLSLGALYYSRSLLRHLTKSLFSHALQGPHVLIWLFFMAWFLKVIFQMLSVLPSLETYAFHNRFIVLAFLHWNFLPLLSIGIIGLATVTGFWRWSLPFARSVGLFALGIVLTELALLLASLYWINPTPWLWWSSLVLFLGIVGMGLGERRAGKNQ